MDSHRAGRSLVACGVPACGASMDRPTNYGGAHGAAPGVLDSTHGVPRTIRIRSAAANFTGVTARSRRRGGRALLSASRIRLARDGNRR